METFLPLTKKWNIHLFILKILLLNMCPIHLQVTKPSSFLFSAAQHTTVPMCFTTCLNPFFLVDSQTVVEYSLCMHLTTI